MPKRGLRRVFFFDQKTECQGIDHKISPRRGVFYPKMVQKKNTNPSGPAPNTDLRCRFESRQKKSCSTENSTKTRAQKPLRIAQHISHRSVFRAGDNVDDNVESGPSFRHNVDSKPRLRHKVASRFQKAPFDGEIEVPF